MNPLVLIPARLAAARLPNKPLADIVGKPMIVRAYEAAAAAGFPVAVAAGDPEIVEAVEAAGGRAVLTDPDLPSGSDRIRAALDVIDPGGSHDRFGPLLLHYHGHSEDLGYRLDGDLRLHVAERVHFTVDRHQRNSVKIGIDFG